MEPGGRTTGTRDEHYDLVSVLYHALHGAENCEVYAVDAEAAGKGELAAFFGEAQATQRRLAERAKELLGIRGLATPGTAEPGTPPEGMAGPEAPPTPGDVRKGTSPEPPPRTGYVTRGAPLPGEERPPEPPPGPTQP